MPEDKATERPWKVETSATHGITWVVGSHGDDICDFYHRAERGEIYRKGNARANATLIVKAVNSHDQLSAIAEEMETALEAVEIYELYLPGDAKSPERAALLSIIESARDRYRKYKEEQE